MKLSAIVLLLLCSSACAQVNVPSEPVVAAASDEALQAITTFRIDPKWKSELVAAEPMVANPVAFTIDNNGRIFVCETFRQELGVTDNRSHDETWIDHDLAAQTVQDRIEYHRKLLPNGGADYLQQDDRVRLLRDSNGDGLIDQATVFANRFNALEDGTAAGVLALDDGVLLTCIPHLWLLRDRDDDGTADERIKLHSGFGVRVAFRGHDMHGLIRGPDGRIYFSVGDRGYNVTTSEGQKLVNPESGAVFRCEVDGTHLEVFATGLRNPQELAFDQYGNLFTGDNNSDSGDKARWVYVVQGADSGWRMAYQYLNDRGPFNREKIWHPFHHEQPAYIVPPIANIGDGPSGLAYYPGTGFADGFKDCFFLCDFRGTASNSGIRTIKVKPHGAFFEIEATQEPIWQILATDLAFGPDGYLYSSDWVSGWVGEGKGRIYRFGDPRVTASSEVGEVKRLLSGGLRLENDESLLALLGHADQRVRLGAQFELVRREAIWILHKGLTNGQPQLVRIHSIWGICQLSRSTGVRATSGWFEPFYDLATDDDEEIRTQIARAHGELHRFTSPQQTLVDLLADPSLRVRAAAAIALSQVPCDQMIQPLVKVLEENNNNDPVLRHAAIMGLSAADHLNVTNATLHHPSVAVRRAAIVALRRKKSPLTAKFLADNDVLVAEEAARAIHDVPIEECMSDLASRFEQFPQSIAFTHRALNANYRIGNEVAAQRMVAISTDARFDALLRTEALEMLSCWSAPSSRDRVLGMWRPIAARDGGPAAKALADQLAKILATGDERLTDVALQSVGALRIVSAAKVVEELLVDKSKSNTLRARAMSTLCSLNPSNLGPIAEQALGDDACEVRIAARKAYVVAEPLLAGKLVFEALTSTDLRERQSANGLIADLPQPTAERLASAQLDRLLRGEISSDTRLDVVESAKHFVSNNSEIAAKLVEYERAAGTDSAAAFRDCLEGGDAENGKSLFFQRLDVSCLRCHRIGDQGGAVGPDLSEIGAKKERQYLLEAIVDPNKAIAEKFETVVIINDLGKTLSGILQAETDDFLRLTTAEGNLITIDKNSIDERRNGKSAMPDDVAKHLTPKDVRDLVEFLASQAPPKKIDFDDSKEPNNANVNGAKVK